MSIALGLAIVFIPPAVIGWVVHGLARKFHSWATYDLEEGYYR